MNNEWIPVDVKKPEWGTMVIVFRGKILVADAYKFNFPPLVEYTTKFDNLITHWMPLNLPKFSEEK